MNKINKDDHCQGKNIVINHLFYFSFLNVAVVFMSGDSTDAMMPAIKLTPNHGQEETTITVVVQGFAPFPAKLAFNNLLVDTNQMQQDNHHTLFVASVPPFQQTHATTSTVPVSICFLKNNWVTSSWFVANFIYDVEDAFLLDTPKRKNEHNFIRRLINLSYYY